MANEAFLQRLCNVWREKLKLANDHKRTVFGHDAEECLRFYASKHDFIYSPAYWSERVQYQSEAGDYLFAQTGAPWPSLRITVNKTAQFVQVFGPFLYYQNPKRTIRARRSAPLPQEVFGLDSSVPAPDPRIPMWQWTPQQQQYAMMLQQYQQMAAQDQADFKKREYKAQLLEEYLNYTPNELDLKTESRMAIDEALIKGRGVVWMSLWQSSQGGMRMPYAAWDSVDNLLLDPDAEKLNEARWCAQRCVEPYWVLADRYGIDRELLRPYARRESLNQQGTTNSYDLGIHHRQIGATADCLVYYRIWSRMGLGARLNNFEDELSSQLEQFGDNVFMVVAEGVPFPLNWNPDLEIVTDIQEAVRWPIEFWRDDIHPWPFAELDFCWRPRSSWPVPPLTFAMGFQQFLDWAYSAIASKVVRSCRDIVLYDASAGDKLLNELREGRDMAIVEMLKSKPGPWDDFVKVLQFPAMQTDIWKMLEIAEKAFEDATSLTDLMRGQSPHQFRSAEEAQLKGDFAKIRPDDMSNRTGHWMSLIARKEGFAAQAELKGPVDILPLLGQSRSAAWDMLVATKDPNVTARELDFRIEAGSSKRPNVELELQNTQEAAQSVLPNLINAWQTTGDPTAVNTFLAAWAKPRDIDPELVKLPPLAPPHPGSPEGPPMPEQPPQKQAA